jgi:ribonuclease VapC
MFVDASAIIAILAREPERDELLDQLGSEGGSTSPIAVYEASHAFARLKSLPLVEASCFVAAFLRQSRITVAAVSEEVGTLAIEASARYGKGSGHPARLNMGDCFSYAMAKHADAPLLYKGDDFIHTDLG